MNSSITSLNSQIRRRGVIYSIRRVVEFAWLKSGLATGLYWRIAPYFYHRRYGSDLLRYDVPIDPFALRWVSPESITRYSGRQGNYYDLIYSVGEVRTGDWDKTKSRSDDGLRYADSIENTLMYQGFKKRFKDGAEWEETNFFSEVLKRIREGNQCWQKCKTKEELVKQCEYVDSLHHRLKIEGYRTQSELRDERETTLETAGYFNEHINEVVVDIARDGELLLLDAKHRLILSKLLNIDRIPVQIVCRHTQWMEKMETAYRNGNIIDHPDFQIF